MKTGPVRDAQQTKQCVYSIPCDCSRCYIGETSRPLEVRIKEHNYNLPQGSLERSKLAQHAYEEGHKICWNEAKVLQIETGNTRNQPACLCWTIRSVNPVWSSLPTGLRLSQHKSRNYNPVKCSFSGKICGFLCWYHKYYCFSPVMISVEILLRCKASYVWSFHNLMFP
jgi:hypothetical protein